jgi:hypothetical protein
MASRCPGRLPPKEVLWANSPEQGFSEGLRETCPRAQSAMVMGVGDGRLGPQVFHMPTSHLCLSRRAVS